MTSREVAIVEVNEGGGVTMIGSWMTVDPDRYPTAFNRLAEDIGFHVAIALTRSEDVRILPRAEAEKLWEAANKKGPEMGMKAHL